MKKNIILISITMLLGIMNCYSQVAIGTSTIKDNVMLQLEANNKGLLLPRVALVNRTSTRPLASTIPTGTIVFNTNLAGTFPNLISSGIVWWNAEEQQWNNINSSIDTAVMKYVNSETSTNYNQSTLQNIKLFGTKVFNESNVIYNVNSTNNTITLGRSGLYAISTLLSFDRLSGGNNSRISLTARLYINDQPVGTEQIINPGYTSSINNDRGLFSHAFTEFLELNDGDVLSVKIKKSAGYFSNNYGTANVSFLVGGDSSISIERIR